MFWSLEEPLLNTEMILNYQKLKALKPLPKFVFWEKKRFIWHEDFLFKRTNKYIVCNFLHLASCDDIIVSQWPSGSPPRWQPPLRVKYLELSASRFRSEEVSWMRGEVQSPSFQALKTVMTWKMEIWLYRFSM